MCNKKAAIVCCSNGQLLSYKEDIEKLIAVLKSKGVATEISDYIYGIDSIASGSACERAKTLMDFYKDAWITDIFDISGGDIANEILPYLDYDVISKSGKCFWGYSDLTTVINAIYTMTGNKSILYQIKNLVWDKTGAQDKTFLSSDMYNFSYQLIQGIAMTGVVVGGNIRCLLKLAGTKYFPDLKGKILFLEALSGGEAQLRTYFAQLYEMEAFSKVNGVLLGTFLEYEKDNSVEELIGIVKEYVGDTIPVAKTQDIGHSSMSKALVIGQEYYIG